MFLPSDPEALSEWSSYLGFLADHGLDLAFEDVPRNLKLEDIKPLPRPTIVAEVSANVNSVPPQNALRHEAACHQAEILIAAAGDLDALYASLSDFEETPLRADGGKGLVRGRGVMTPQLMIVGDPPSRSDDQTGEAFTGPEGRLIEAMLKAAGLTDQAYLSHAAFYRPAGQRPLNDEDFALNHLFLKAVIAHVKPATVLLMGACATRTVLGSRDGIPKLRPQRLSLDAQGHTVAAQATFSPQFLLTQPLAKAAAWHDVLRLKNALKGA